MRLLEIPVYREEGREGGKGACKEEGGREGMWKGGRKGKGACKEEGGREGMWKGGRKGRKREVTAA